jgi:uncharacterized protein YndB with AHSA1/START domain
MGEERRLEKVVELDAKPEQVWEAITTSGGLASWLFPVEIEPGEGGTSSFGTVTAWEPGRRFAVRGSASEDGSTQAFEYRIEAREGGGTVLRFVHSGFAGDGWEAEYDGFSHGWDMYFHTLGQYLTHFPGRTAAYVLAQGPPASAGQDAWSRLVDRLGLRGEVREGDPVRLTPEGLTPIEGVVDYARPSFFLGVRTADALYRFHVRAVMGMPVAVGHHVFLDSVDAGEAGQAWGTWLQGVYARQAIDPLDQR